MGGVRHLDPEVKMGIFLNGLREEIQAKLKVSQFWTLSTMMDKALELEERNLAWKEGGVGSFHKGLGHFKGVLPSRPLGPIRSTGGSSLAAYSERGRRGVVEAAGYRRRAEPRKLSQEEWQKQQRRGLCFKCGNPCGRDHVCPMRRMPLLLVEEDGEGEEDIRGGKVDHFEDGGTVRVMNNMRLSLKRFVGLTSNKSFKVEGEIEGRKVVVLVDSRASGNFNTNKLARELGLGVQSISTFTIEVGNGQREQGEGVCCGVKMLVQGILIQQNFFLMELGGTEVILGIDWLFNLGKIEADFQEMTLKWKADGKVWEIIGDLALCHA